ncbi:MAG: VOC family protein [Ignavibacteriales bacterium]|nr:VOC family protein [Ignavibacteriales bacterium]
MNRVTGIGGIFFKCDNPEQQKEWYRKHLGIESDQYGATFEWLDINNPDKKCTTVWSPFSSDTKYFLPSEKQYMFNYRVENLVELLKTLREEGVEVIDKVEEYEFGKFGWIVDPEGNKIELWEPVDEKLK